MSSSKDGGRDRLLLGISVTVTGVWVVATLVQVIDPHRQVPPTVNAIMGIIVTALFSTYGVRTIRRNGNGG